MTDVPSIDFEAETRPEGTNGHYQKEIPWGWEGGPGVPYGGWTTAVALRAAGLESNKERPASLAAQFLRPLSLDVPLDLDVEVLRRGQRAEFTRVTVAQRGRAGIHAFVTSTNAVEGLEYEPERAPAPIDHEGLPTLGEVVRAQGGVLPDGHHIEHYEYRVPHDRIGEGILSADGKQALVGWIRYGPGMAYDDPWVEAARACVPADTQVPAAFLRAGLLGGGPHQGLDKGTDKGTRRRGGRSPMGTALRGTTLDLLLHFHRTERSTPWLWYETHVQVAHGGLASGTCNLWSEDGLLLATSMSQVAFLPRR